MPMLQVLLPNHVLNGYYCWVTAVHSVLFIERPKSSRYGSRMVVAKSCADAFAGVSRNFWRRNLNLMSKSTAEKTAIFYRFRIAYMPPCNPQLTRQLITHLLKRLKNSTARQSIAWQFQWHDRRGCRPRKRKSSPTHRGILAEFETTGE